MTPKTTGSAALILAVFALVGGAIVSAGIVPTPAAYAQLPDVGDIVDDAFDSLGLSQEEEGTNIEQPNDQEVSQEEVDQSEVNDQDDNNAQIQTGVDDQDTAQGIVDSDDLAESGSESGEAKKRYSSSSSSFADAANEDEQGAVNDGELNQDHEQDVDQDHSAIFADDSADLDDANVAVPIAVPISVQEEQQEEVVEEEPPVDEEDTITVCIDPGESNIEREVTLEELEELIEEDVFFEIGECPTITME